MVNARPRHALVSAVAAIAACLLLTAASCGGGSSSTKSTSSSTSATSSTTAPTTAAPTTTAPPAPTMYFETHEQAADHLFDAWQKHDRVEALRGATTEAVDALFAINPDGWYRYYYGGYCDTGEFDQGTCNFRSEDMYARVLSTHTPPGWQVTSVRISQGL